MQLLLILAQASITTSPEAPEVHPEAYRRGGGSKRTACVIL